MNPITNNLVLLCRLDALMFGLTLRILNYNFTDQLLNASSAEYQEFASILMSEVMLTLKTFKLWCTAGIGNMWLLI